MLFTSFIVFCMNDIFYSNRDNVMLSSVGIFLIQIAVNKIFSLLFIIFYVKILLTKITRKGVNFMITVSINAHPDIEDKINNYVKENNINLNQVMLDLILEKIEDEEDYKLAIEAYEEEKDNRENWISHEDLIKKLGLENEI